MIKGCKVTHCEHNLDGETGVEGVWENDTGKYTHTHCLRIDTDLNFEQTTETV